MRKTFVMPCLGCMCLIGPVLESDYIESHAGDGSTSGDSLPPSYSKQ